MTRRATGKPVESATKWAVYPRLTVFGLLVLGVAVVMSVLLALQSLEAFALPGCGAGSPCAKAAASAWGKVPGVGWPVSFLGLAYFGAAMTGWWVAGGRPTAVAIWLVRVAAAVSALYVGVALLGGYPCPYCLIANACGLVFWVIVEYASWKAGGTGLLVRQRIAVPAGAAVFLGSTVVLGVIDQGVRTRETAKAAGQAQQTVGEVTGAKGQAAKPEADRLAVPLVGRWRQGPERAALRIVMFTDYQCRDCRQVEAELASAIVGRSDVSVAVRYFPLCPDCNKYMPENMHPNACWAARAAETAGLIGGAEGYAKMHRWLFARGGSFTDAELKAALPGLGFEAGSFTARMEQPETLRAVQEDVELGAALGIHYTPLIFANGVEVRGWQVSGVLKQAIERMLASGLSPAMAENDRPPLGVRKAVEDWRDGPMLDLPRDATRPALGSMSATPARRVVVIGDLIEPNTAEVDAKIRGMIEGGADIRYEFRQFPLNRACNPACPRDIFEHSCLAARAAEGAGLAGGAISQRMMHKWLFDNRDRLSEQALFDGAPALATSGEQLLAAMSNPVIEERIARDVALAQRLGVNAIPAVYVDGRWVPRLKMSDGAGGTVDVLERVLRSAPPAK